MKKILVLLLSGAIFLCACSPKGNHSSPSSTPKPSKQSQVSSDSIEQDEKAYASTLDSLKNDTSEGRADLYAFYDIAYLYIPFYHCRIRAVRSIGNNGIERNSVGSRKSEKEIQATRKST